MKRVMVLGCSGSGKSTFARALGEILGAPVVHIDTLYWKPGWRRRTPKEFAAAMVAAHAGDEWISDGNFVRPTGAAMRTARADAIIYLDQPRWLCLRRALTRIFVRPEGYGRGYPQMLTFEGVGFVLTFDARARPQIERLLAAHSDRAVRLRGDKEIGAYLAKLKQSLAA